MKNRFLSLLCTVCLTAIFASGSQTNDNATKDWAQHERYAEANKSLTQAPDVVFMGNSITDSWFNFHPEFFTSHNFAGRGISGQVTSQMLCRFKADVIDLHPKAVVICGGVNDIVGNNGSIDLPYIVDNVVSMIDLARSHDIIPIVATALPTNYAFWKPDFKNLGELIKSYNEQLLKMCHDKGVTMIDYYTPMVDAEGGLAEEYSLDRLHPNTHGYEAVMEPVALETINKVLSSK